MPDVLLFSSLLAALGSHARLGVSEVSLGGRQEKLKFLNRALQHIPDIGLACRRWLGLGEE